MRVLYYWQQIPEIAASPHLSLFRESWLRHWNDERPDLELNELGIQHAEDHPIFERLRHVTNSAPTVNLRSYERACWKRWAAYATAIRHFAEPCLCVDADLMNCNWQPAPWMKYRGGMLSLHTVPTVAVIMDPAAAERWLVRIVRDIERGLVRIGDRMHVSDMTLAQACPQEFNWAIETAEADDLIGCLSARLRHCSSRACTALGVTQTGACQAALESAPQYRIEKAGKFPPVS